MAKRNQVFKCEVCGHIVEILHDGVGELVCCNQPMKLLTEKNQDEGMEKHIPVIEITETGLKVKVGSIPHPMLEEHYIEWIEVIADGRTYKKFLNPGDAPEAEFCLKAESFSVRAHCNIHGLWRNG